MKGRNRAARALLASGDETEKKGDKDDKRAMEVRSNPQTA
jgi:hypothetical protein